MFKNNIADVLSGLSLDLKLGYRMLVKYPGLTLVGGLAMAFAIWFGAVAFQMYGLVTSTKLPLPDGDRIVRIQSMDTKTQQDEDRVLYDYQHWISARSITDIGAYRDASINVVGADRNAQTVVTAEITASAFRIAPERPLLGRVLSESDERAGAAPVVVLGYDVWSRRFASDPRIIGQSVQLGKTFATVVGVMPEGYAFPVAHELWLPLRTDAVGVEPRTGAPIKVFGRLTDGSTLEGAQAELTAIGKRLTTQHPATHAQLQPHVLPYAQFNVNTGDMKLVMLLTYFFVVAIVVVVCSTVALLLFARAAARETELLVRSALGASRRRIVMQLFLEALVLAGVAAVVGLGAAQLALTRWGEPYLDMNMEMLPFWYDFSLSPTTIVYALALALLGAVVAGVMPARKITRGLGAKLRAGTAGGGGVSFGGVWTAVIVAQVALTVMLPSVTMILRGESKRIASYDAGFATEKYLGVNVGVDISPDEALTPEARAALSAQVSTSLAALRRSLEAEPGVAGVTFANRLPREGFPGRPVQVMSLPGNPFSWAAAASIDPSYFAVLETPIITGRAFTSADLAADAHVVIVDQNFADLVMKGRNPVGHRVRFTSAETPDSIVAKAPTYEIIGLVKNLGMGNPAQAGQGAGVYLPAVPGSQGALNMIVHSRADPLSLAPRIRELATAVDPSLRIEKIMPLDDVVNPLLWFLGLWTNIIFGLTGVALLLSLSGIYSVLSYIVARRTREIGVRVALGATARRVITAIFKRPMIQVTLGVIAGCGLIALAAIGIQNTTQFEGTETGGLGPTEVAMLIGYAILMLGVCALACVVPTRRALRVQPTQAMRAE